MTRMIAQEIDDEKIRELGTVLAVFVQADRRQSVGRSWRCKRERQQDERLS